jgi:hypothetical protein
VVGVGVGVVGVGLGVVGVGLGVVGVGLGVGDVTITCVVTVLAFGSCDPGTAIMTVAV